MQNNLCGNSNLQLYVFHRFFSSFFFFVLCAFLHASTLSSSMKVSHSNQFHLLFLVYKFSFSSIAVSVSNLPIFLCLYVELAISMYSKNIINAFLKEGREVNDLIMSKIWNVQIMTTGCSCYVLYASLIASRICTLNYE
jgi:hypothetical protein